MELKVYNQAGKASGKIEVAETVFGAEYNEALIHQVVVAQLANARQGTKSTLTRAEVRGGGAKPWRQKGTGRARQGSIRSPQWKGGGIVFAPKPRDFSKKINKKMKTAALKSALSAKVAAGTFVVVDELKLKEAKTKLMAQVLKNFEYRNTAVLVTAENDELIFRAANNIPGVDVMEAALVNVYDVVRCGAVIITKDAVKKIEEALA